jgi:hypothetical protein
MAMVGLRWPRSLRLLVGTSRWVLHPAAAAAVGASRYLLRHANRGAGRVGAWRVVRVGVSRLVVPEGAGGRGSGLAWGG